MGRPGPTRGPAPASRLVGMLPLGPASRCAVEVSQVPGVPLPAPRGHAGLQQCLSWPAAARPARLQRTRTWGGGPAPQSCVWAESPSGPRPRWGRGQDVTRGPGKEEGPASARARAWCHSCGSPRFPCGPVPPGSPLAQGCWGSGPTSFFLDVSPGSGSCRSGAAGVSFLQPRRWLFICGLGGPCPFLGHVGQSPGPFVTLALEAPTSVLGGLAGPHQDPWPASVPG